MEEDHPEAIRLYSDALTLASKNASLFRLDPLQRLHVVTNLAECLAASRDATEQPAQAPGPALHAEHLMNEAQGIANSLIAAVAAGVRINFSKFAANYCRLEPAAVLGPRARLALSAGVPPTARDGIALSVDELGTISQALFANTDVFDAIHVWLMACIDQIQVEDILDDCMAHISARCNPSASGNGLTGLHLTQMLMFNSVSSVEGLRAVAFDALRDLGTARRGYVGCQLIVALLATVAI